MIYVDINNGLDYSSTSYSAIEGLEHVEIDDYDKFESLFSYIVDRFEKDTLVAQHQVLAEIIFYNAEMGIDSDCKAIYNVMVELEMIKELIRR
jgi:hypothetical protein